MLDRDSRYQTERPRIIPTLERGEYCPLSFRILENTGCDEPLDLSGATEIEFRLWKDDNTVLIKRLSTGGIIATRLAAGRFLVPLEAEDTLHLRLTPQQLDDPRAVLANPGEIRFVLNGEPEIITVKECVRVLARLFPA